MQSLYDVIVIGSGAVGSSVARELTRYKLRVCVLEKNQDVARGITGRCTGMLHAGFLWPKGSLKAELVMEGNAGMDQLAAELKFPFKRCGKLIIGNEPDEYERTLIVKAQGEASGVEGLVMLNKEELHEMEPHVYGEFAMLSSRSGLFSPYGYNVALAENAVSNGAEYHFNSEVLSIDRTPEGYHAVNTKTGTYISRWVVNAAGLGSEKVAHMMGFTQYKLRYVKAQYILLDKKSGERLKRPAYPAPDKDFEYDVHATPTLDGNVLIGPTNDEPVETVDFDSTQKRLDVLMAKGGMLYDGYRDDYQIRNYCGMFPQAVDPETGEDLTFQIDIAPEEHVVNLVGITSPGLTSSYPIARRVIRMIKGVEELEENPNFNPYREPILKAKDLDVEARAKLIEENPDYGEIICRCEEISKAEILQAIHNPLGTCSIASIKYRCRATMGRCQGGYCQTRIAELIRQETGMEMEDIRLDGPESYMFTGKVRE